MLNVIVVIVESEYDQSLSIGGRCAKDPCGIVSCLLFRPWLDLVRGPAGPIRGERAAERDREGEADRCSCDVRVGDAKAPVGNEDGGAVRERRGRGGEVPQEET